MGTTDADERAFGLSEEQRAQFHRDGYLAPLRLCSPEQARERWDRIQREVFDRGRPDGSVLDEKGYPVRGDRHRDSRAVYELVTDDRIVDKLADLYGDDLLLWFSNVWDKSPRASAVGWHQEMNVLPVYPPVCGMAWIALTEVTEENGCLELVPGSHRRPIPHVPTDGTDEYSLEEVADPDAFDEREAVSIELDPGEFVLFSSRILHRSNANRSDDERVGVNLATMPPHVSVDRSEYDWFLPELRPMLVSGRNRPSLHETMSPPE